MDPADQGEESASVHVEVSYSPGARQVDVVSIELPAGSTVADAITASGLLDRHALDITALSCGVWGRVQALGTTLRERDRIEIYRPLLVDPKEARRLRYKRQRAG